MNQPRMKRAYPYDVSTLALFVALGGSAWAVSELERNDVKSKHIARGAVKNPDLANDAVTSDKVLNGTLLGEDFGPGQLPAGPQGEPGERGPSGATNVVVRRQPGNRADCAAGERAVGGGGDMDLGELFRSRPIPNEPGATPTGWEAAGTSAAIITYVVCASP